MTQKANHSITNLGVLPGFEGSKAATLDNNDQVVGTSWRDSLDFEPCGFLWHGGVMSSLGDVIPNDINDKGQIVGTSRKSFLNFTAHDDKPRSFSSRSTTHWAEAINENGQVVGYSLFIWQDGSVNPLGEPQGFRSTQAEAINDLGQVLV